MKKTNDDEIEIDLLELFRALWNRALIIILVAVLTASAVFAFTFFFISPSYDATASIYVNNSSFSFGSTSFSISSSELSASNSLVNTYIYILKSRTTLEDVISKANLPYTYEELSEMITTNAITGTAAFDVTVRSSSPTEAEHIAGIVIVRFLIDEQNDVVIHSADELKELYPNIKVLAMIPDMRLSEKKGYYYSSYYGDKAKGGK